MQGAAQVSSMPEVFSVPGAQEALPLAHPYAIEDVWSIAHVTHPWRRKASVVESIPEDKLAAYFAHMEKKLDSIHERVEVCIEAVLGTKGTPDNASRREVRCLAPPSERLEVGPGSGAGPGGSSAALEVPGPRESREEPVEPLQQNPLRLTAQSVCGERKLSHNTPSVYSHKSDCSGATIRSTRRRDIFHPYADSKSTLIKRMWERSASKNMDNFAKKIQELPRQIKTSRSQLLQDVWEVMDDPSSSARANFVNKALQSFVLLTVLITFLQTIDDPFIYGSYAALLELSFDVVFMAEVLVRLVVCPNRWSFFLTSYNWIDIVASFPPLCLRVAFGFLRDHNEDSAMRTIFWCGVPVCRLLKMLRHFETFHLLLEAVKITFEALPMLLYTLLLLTLTFAGIIYTVEPRENIGSLPRAVWLCVVTITTVGYGDTGPVTPAGYTIIIVLIISGVIFMAIPIGIIGNTFNVVWDQRDYMMLITRTRSALHKWGYTAHDLPKLFKLVDDGNGVLELDEFIALLREMRIGLPEARMIQLFNHLDTDDSGAVDAKEFAAVLFPGTYVEAYGHEHHPTLLG